MGAARDTLIESLRDRDVHRAALEGAVGSFATLNPFRRKDDRDDASSTGRKTPSFGTPAGGKEPSPT